ncbi:MAG: hypothetical protein NUV77_08960 [Thermoguttaceae bacterium]|nr:hypothetical protein [Thermoguttaceae bacterium]
MAVLSLVVLGSPLVCDCLAATRIELRVSAAEREILEEYRAMLARLKEGYGNMSMEGIRREASVRAYTSSENPEGKRASYLVFCARGERLFRAESRGLTPDGQTTTGRTGVLLVRPEGYVRASNTGVDGAMVVGDWGDYEEGLAELSYLAFQWSPCRAYVAPVETWIFGPLPFRADTYSIEKVEEALEGSKRLVRIHTTAAWKDRRQRRNVFTFYRDKCWALKEITLGMRSPMGENDELLRGTYEYGGTAGGLPLLKRVAYWRELGPAQTRGLVETFEVVKIDLRPPPESQFTAEALGITLGPPRAVWLGRLAMLLVGVAMIALFLLLRRRERRERPSPSSVAE